MDFFDNIKEGIVKNWLENLGTGVLSFFWSVVLSLLTYLIGMRVISMIRSIVRRMMEKRNVDLGVRQFTDGVLKIICYISLGIMILNLFGIQTMSFSAAVASLGVTTGLALQGALSNFAGGVLILVLRPFAVGDYIIEDTHSNEGTVSEISIFYTKLQTIDNRVIVIPNGTLANSSLVNVTTADMRQIDLRFSISYNSDIRVAKGILTQIAVDTPERIEDQDMRVFVSSLEDSSVELGLRFWVPTDEYWNVRWRLMEQIKEGFDANGVTIPYNQLDVHIDNDSGGH